MKANNVLYCSLLRCDIWSHFYTKYYTCTCICVGTLLYLQYYMYIHCKYMYVYVHVHVHCIHFSEDFLFTTCTHIYTVLIYMYVHVHCICIWTTNIHSPSLILQMATSSRVCSWHSGLCEMSAHKNTIFCSHTNWNISTHVYKYNIYM